GPFAAGSLDERLILLDTFMAVAAVTGLLLGAVTAERQHSRARLRRAHDQLETRVEVRTRELAQANADLAQKNEEVEAFVYIVSHDLRAPLVNLQGFARELEASCQRLTRTLAETSLPEPAAQKTQPILGDEIPRALR